MRPRLIIPIGKRFGLLTVTALAGPTPGGVKYECSCDCGRLTYTAGSKLVSGRAKSCGCLKKQNSPKYKGGRSNHGSIAYFNKLITKSRHNAARHSHRPLESTGTELARLWAEHSQKCGICDSALRVLHIDHDHETGEFRGFLCPQCNRGIGLLGGSSDILRRAADYLSPNKA